MELEKKFLVNYDDGNKIIDLVLADPNIGKYESIIIGAWEDAWEEPAQKIIDMFIEHKERFLNLKELFIGDMDYTENEVSWILQGNYEIINTVPYKHFFL